MVKLIGKGKKYRRVSEWVLLLRLLQEALSCEGSFRYRLGMILFLGNWPVGYGGVMICAMLSTYYKKGWIASLGGVCYILSWIMLGVSVVLLGKPVVTLKKRKMVHICRAWRRLNAMRRRWRMKERERLSARQKRS